MAKKAKADAGATEGAEPKKRKPNAAFNKPVEPDDVLGSIVGNEPQPRSDITKKLWAYIKEQKLQTGRNIKADDKLRAFFGKDEITMFELPKQVAVHIKKSAPQTV